MPEEGPFVVVAVLLGSYLLGAVPVGVLVGRRYGIDIRKHGSGNIGFTNVTRAIGWGPGLFVFAFDVIKGAAPMALTRALWAESDPWLGIAGGALGVIGHNYSCFLRFRGGKGVSTTLGATLALQCPIGLIAFGTFLVVVAATRYVSLGSLAGTAVLPFLGTCVFGMPIRSVEVGFLAGLSLLAAVRHRANIGRLLKGTENKIGGRKK